MSYSSKIQNDSMDALFEAILSLENKEECYRFFEDICTIKELKAISQRLEVVKLLVSDQTYHAIEKQTGASTATISRINRALNYGADGYNLVLKRLGYLDEKKDEEEEK
ncbi:YerC/YecD family TrpR-related protein [Aedoeadaptatus acetigenes]|uniref:YerC/YecD family TrpR-related protein n=1 Tax=Aedoeadaptatus acetigenes TaxID=2981723 RepID=A0ABV1J5Y6_9FIRM|nr:YerC/YecD family TrpR-related protein [Aedoeadaptatus acetigenes]MBS6524381.1 TrpR-like protein YerC/YecD [Peptoniphilaceae bacterium]MCU6785639.1 YerC/YecD family TrpR-related protein [Aedoeadaptatus acetigenes]